MRSIHSRRTSSALDVGTADSLRSKGIFDNTTLWSEQKQRSHTSVPEPASLWPLGKRQVAIIASYLPNRTAFLLESRKGYSRHHVVAHLLSKSATTARTV